MEVAGQFAKNFMAVGGAVSLPLGALYEVQRRDAQRTQEEVKELKREVQEEVKELKREVEKEVHKLKEEVKELKKDVHETKIDVQVIRTILERQEAKAV
eukprot:CAMPEP_0184370774 /NCGR_PEP_ID=MMETSP1089-20130417/163020_1 /TAXON_ID=38269 ORGANISM="Gloeochaete wittrockiana, Strain SAG46.84" /NCGR_SAMPLE_ID=MMETSP1089 /ASSEMBLY_ACC=CAM_ASM_000445 /LENGTH=98 /DNA_ID=CAMNT_0026713433 /DNA_START=159 /DNA_END=455 /DNA_ORIENTATION=-